MQTESDLPNDGIVEIAGRRYFTPEKLSSLPTKYTPTLADDLAELAEIVNAAVGLTESVLDCVRIYERERGTEGLFGPSDGLSWIMTTLDNKARECRDRALREQEEGRAAQ